MANPFGPYDPNDPFGLRSKTSPFAPPTDIQSPQPNFGTPPIAAPGRMTSLDPRDPLGVGTQKPLSRPYDNIFGGKAPGTENQNIVAAIFGDGQRQQQTQPSSMPPGATQSVIDQYFQRKMDNMPTRQETNMANVGSTLGSFSSGEKANRIIEGNYTQNFDNMMLDHESNMNTQRLAAQQDRRANESDALAKVQQTEYLKNGGSNYGPASIQLGGKSVQLPSFSGIAPTPTTDTERQAAGTLQSQMLERLKPGGSFEPSYDYKPHELNSYAKPGMTERLSGYAGAGVSGLGSVMDMFSGGQGSGGAMNTLSNLKNAGSSIARFFGGGGSGSAGTLSSYGPSHAMTMAGSGVPAGAGSVMGNMLGKAVPLAGAVTGGIGLMKNRGLGQNVMNGVSTGASIGSIVPGLGTAIGAGVGGLVGGLRTLFGGKKKSPQQVK